MTPRDAQLHWLAARIPNDQFLLYCFDGATNIPVDQMLSRAARIPDLGLRVHEVPHHLDYPYWARREVSTRQIITHHLSDPTLRGFQSAMGTLLTQPLDATECAWRLHFFPDVVGTLIVVLQCSHALADGRGASALARLLLSDEAPPIDPRATRSMPDWALAARGVARLPWRVPATVARGWRAHRLTQRTEPAETGGFPLASVNTTPGPGRHVRFVTLPVRRLRASDATVTVTVLSAIGAALARQEARAGRTEVRLGAEVTVAHPIGPARNNFGNVGVDLHPGEPDPARRAGLITAALTERRTRPPHPVTLARRAVTAGLPAPAMWREIQGYPLNLTPATVTGNTVVSSVSRGPADMGVGGRTVRWTAGFPALSPVMGLTHGVHGIGDTVTITVVAGSAVPIDIDTYIEDLLSNIPP